MDMRAGYLGLQECGPSADGARCHQALGPQGDPHQGAGVSGHALAWTEPDGREGACVPDFASASTSLYTLCKNLGSCHSLRWAL
eukprot:scaffold266116_cov18-Tisochrysis_lutea.AAC.1